MSSISECKFSIQDRTWILIWDRTYEISLSCICTYNLSMKTQKYSIHVDVQTHGPRFKYLLAHPPKKIFHTSLYLPLSDYYITLPPSNLPLHCLNGLSNFHTSILFSPVKISFTSLQILFFLTGECIYFLMHSL